MEAEEQTQKPLKRGAPIGNRRVLESLPSTTRTTSANAAARSLLIRRLRIALPVLAGVLLVILFVTTRDQQDAPVFLDDLPTLANTTEELKMASPRFTGIDDKGSPFEITAEFAIQHPNKNDLVELQNPKAVQGQSDNANTVTAEKGVYRSDENILDLSEQVTLEHDVGDSTYILTSSEAQVLIADEIVTSDVGVGAKGPAGETLRADTMKAYNADGRIVFKGNVSMRIFPKSATKKEKSPNPSFGTSPNATGPNTGPNTGNEIQLDASRETE